MMAAERAAARTTTDWSRVALGVSIGAFSAYQQFKLPPILPDFLARYPHSPVVAAGFMSVYALVGLLVSGSIGRRLDAALGRFLVALFVLTVIGVTLALAAPQSGPLMLLSRALEGLAFAIGAIAGPAIAGAASRPRDLPLVTGLLAGWIPIGQIAAGLMALAFGTWRPLWLVGLALSLPLGLWAWLLLRERSTGARIDRPKVPQPSAGQSRQLILAGAIFLLWSGQYFAFMTWLTQYLSDVLALNRQSSVLAYLLPVVVLLGFNILTGWGLRHGMKLLPAMLAALLLQALVWFAQPWLRGDLGLLGLVAYGIGAGVTPTCLFHLPHLIARGTAGATAFGILMTGRNIGVFLGPIVLALLIGSGAYGLDLGWSGGARVMAGVTLAAALVALGLWREQRSA
jgi:predicted MFS family arabinose efflux permease